MRTVAIRLNAVAAATAVLLGAAVIPAVAADCNDGLLACDFTRAEQTSAAAVTLDAVATTVPLLHDDEDPAVNARARSYYASLLGGRAGMPLGAAPAVGLSVRATTDVSGAETIESTVALYASRGDENGWLVVSRVVTDGAADQRAVGIPATGGDGTFDGTSGTTSTATGTPAVSLTYAAGSAADDGRLTAFTTRREPTFGVTPVITGTTPWRISHAARPRVPAADVIGRDPVGQDGLTSVATPAQGTVTFSVNPDLNLINADLPAVFADGVTLADVIPAEGSSPGQSWSTEALLVTQADNTDDDRGPLPVTLPPVPTDDLPLLPSALAVAGLDPGTGQAGYIVNQHTVVRGTQLWQTNIDSVAHPVVCADPNGTQRPDLCDTEGSNVGGDLLPVSGSERLQPGTYFYVCRMHNGDPSTQTGMWGSFTVVGT